MYNIKDMISSILNNIDYNYLVHILIRCSTLYRGEQSKPIAKAIVDNYFVPDHLDSSKKIEVYNFGLGVFYYSIKDYARSIEYYDKALAVDAENLSALNNKGTSLNYLGRYTEAIKYLDKVLAINPKHDNALNNKGMSLDSLGKYNEAIEYYDKVLAINPKHDNALNNKGSSLNNLGRYKEAIECLDKALAIDPKHDGTLRIKEIALRKLKDKEGTKM
jgi:tetratricopeptide (TPR) repeat protein